MNFKKGDFILLKEWYLINNKYPHFINEDYYGEEEIYIEEDNWYMGSDYKNVLGNIVRISAVVHTTGLEDKYIIGDYTITPFMILRGAEKELDPECFI